jgi:cAMP-dependent protein kinase regulator
MAVKKDQEEPQDFIAKKEYKKAIVLLRDRVGKQPKNPAMRMTLADTLLVDGQTEEAVKEYKDLGSLYIEQGFIVKAIAVYKKVLKLAPSLSEVEKLLSELSDKRVMDSKPRMTAMKSPSEQEAPAVPSEPEKMSNLEIETKLFQGFSAEEFRQVVSKLSLHHYEEDTIVVLEGDPGDSMFIVVRGEVRVLTKNAQQKEVILANLGEGEFFGEVSLLTGRPRTATILTNVVSELLELTREDYERIAVKYPHVKAVLQEFHQQRAYKTVETMIQSLRSKP